MSEGGVTLALLEEARSASAFITAHDGVCLPISNPTVLIRTAPCPQSLLLTIIAHGSVWCVDNVIFSYLSFERSALLDQFAGFLGVPSSRACAT